MLWVCIYRVSIRIKKLRKLGVSFWYFAMQRRKRKLSHKDLCHKLLFKFTYYLTWFNRFLWNIFFYLVLCTNQHKSVKRCFEIYECIVKKMKISCWVRCGIIMGMDIKGMFLHSNFFTDHQSIILHEIFMNSPSKISSLYFHTISGRKFQIFDSRCGNFYLIIKMQRIWIRIDDDVEYRVELQRTRAIEEKVFFFYIFIFIATFLSLLFVCNLWDNSNDCYCETSDCFSFYFLKKCFFYFFPSLLLIAWASTFLSFNVHFSLHFQLQFLLYHIAAQSVCTK
jgi:hypothetical protein